MTAIDIRRPFEILATCPECGMQRNLPEDWQDILRRSMEPSEALAWDGQLRCRKDHEPQVMVTEPIRNYVVEVDGSVIAHLVMDDDRRRAWCTGELWAGVPNDLPPGTLVRQCQACARGAWRED